MTQQEKEEEEQEGKKWDQAAASWLLTQVYLLLACLERGSSHKKSSFTFAPSEAQVFLSQPIIKVKIEFNVSYDLSVMIWFAKDQQSLGCGECSLLNRFHPELSSWQKM